ncbi:M48 family metalloprotease [Pontivivens insulae]|uniref:Metalloprotease LoiP n=1 Tax=Pontivivens insulae TaxID=1639689 RepID=A0A2R8AEU8_9RHOB|nr:M48 family metalloprotease [Pontivivens insulae]RED11960.1 peptidase M48-like protein [Pontivivens insulae]SPF30716.1 Metalloprotease LoiP [Pontivivens insulae]
MRLALTLTAAIALAGCATTFEVPDAPVANLPDSAAPAANRSVSAGEQMMQRVATRIEPIAEDVCRQETGQTRGCDFVLQIDRSGGAPNAFQTIGSDGRPLIVFNEAMLRTIRNDNEIAFIMGHEAGHQIAGHLARRQSQVGLGGLAGAILGGVIGLDQQQSAEIGAQIGGRAYSQSFELEADVLGTYIAERAGYDPVDGAASFSRFRGSNSVLSTHPPGQQRYSTVVATAQRIAAQRAQGLTPTIPRN